MLLASNTLILIYIFDSLNFKDESTRINQKSTNGCCWKNSSSDKLVSTDDQSDDNESFHKLESDKLLDDATRLFTMMNKDYIGGPGSGSKPRHKPPINNFQPLHTSNP